MNQIVAFTDRAPALIAAAGARASYRFLLGGTAPAPFRAAYRPVAGLPAATPSAFFASGGRFRRGKRQPFQGCFGPSQDFGQ
jgi:hypothetical protein